MKPSGRRPQPVRYHARLVRRKRGAPPQPRTSAYSKWVACDGKAAYSSQVAAEGARAALSMVDVHFGDLNVYECRYCGDWHLGGLGKRLA